MKIKQQDGREKNLTDLDTRLQEKKRQLDTLEAQLVKVLNHAELNYTT